MENKKEFVEKLSEVLNYAKPHLTCEYEKNERGEFVIVTAANGYKYTVDVTCNSLSAIGMEVFKAMAGK